MAARTQKWGLLAIPLLLGSSIFFGLLQQGNKVTALERLSATPLPPHNHDDHVHDTGKELVRGGLNLELAPGQRTAQMAANLPTGFVLDSVVTGLNLGVAFDFAPDGRIFIGEKGGGVRVVENGSLLTAPFIDISTQVNSHHDRGLLGLAIHPDFPNQPYIYLLFVYDPPETVTAVGLGGADQGGNRVSRLIRLTADPAQGHNVALPGSELVLWGKNSTWANIGDPFSRNGTPSCFNFSSGNHIPDCVPTDEVTHAIGTVKFAPDGSLYAGTGDSGNFAAVDVNSLRAIDLDSMVGRIVRLNPATGEGYNDNPFFDGDYDSNRSKTVAYGFRNPFRFTFHPISGTLFIGDVGGATWEEVDKGVGYNFGWPCYEGGNGVNLQHSGFAAFAECVALVNAGTAQPPLYAYPHTASSNSIQLGDFYQGIVYPSEYQGALFFSDINEQFIKYLTFDSSGNPTVHDFGTNASGIVQMTAAPDSNLYVMDIYQGTLFRLRYVAGGNTPPTAAIDYTYLGGNDYDFSSVNAFDPDGDPLSYLWDFGDGTISATANPSHTFPAAATYTVTLVVTDTGNLTGTTNVQVIAGNNFPTAQITSPISGFIYLTGDPVIFTGLGNDVEDGNLTGSSLTWEAHIHHNDHDHLDYYNGSTVSGTLTAADHEDNSYLIVCLTATDSVGLSAEDCINIYPEETTLMITSSPEGLILSYSSLNYTTPFTVTTYKRGERNIAALPFQGEMALGGWSDGGAATHNIIIPDQPSTITASYTAAGIVREYWDGISGGDVADLRADINYPDAPTGMEVIVDDLDQPYGSYDAGNGDDYGARFRGYLHPPATGVYTFYLASDNSSELWLSSDEDAGNKQLIAHVPGFTSRFEWDKYVSPAFMPGQQSVTYTLTAGQKVYLEILHKEADLGDHLQVAWQSSLPNSIEIIDGAALTPYNPSGNNHAPQITNPGLVTSTTEAVINLPITIFDADDNKLLFQASGLPNGVAIDLNTGVIAGILTADSAGIYQVTLTANDPYTSVQSSFTWFVSDLPVLPITATGRILHEWWLGIPGSDVVDLTNHANYPSNPSGSDFLEAVYLGYGDLSGFDDLGTRLRGYLSPPVTGVYTFYLASDNGSELWLSSDDTAANAALIASVSGFTALEEWGKYPTQTSPTITLQLGQEYYFELLHKEGDEGAHVEAGWFNPDEPEQPIWILDGRFFRPYDPGCTPLPPILTLTETLGDLTIDWQGWAVNHHYDVKRSSTPFQAGMPASLYLSTPGFNDRGVVSSEQNYFYEVTAIGHCGLEMPAVNSVGIFHFSMTTGN